MHVAKKIRPPKITKKNQKKHNRDLNGPYRIEGEILNAYKHSFLFDKQGLKVF